jgi:hypothetical protein
MGIGKLPGSVGSVILKRELADGVQYEISVAGKRYIVKGSEARAVRYAEQLSRIEDIKTKLSQTPGVDRARMMAFPVFR